MVIDAEKRRRLAAMALQKKAAPSPSAPGPFVKE